LTVETLLLGSESFLEPPPLFTAVEVDAGGLPVVTGKVLDILTKKISIFIVNQM
jgi:hypothetical protein